MKATPFSSQADYSQFLAELLDRPTIKRSTVVVWSTSRYTGVAEGEIFFEQDLRLRIREELDFWDNMITSYGYEVYRGKEKLYWYDDFPHPEDATLAETFPHHKHVPPDIKRHRVPAPEISYSHPNLPFLIDQIEQLLQEA